MFSERRRQRQLRVLKVVVMVVTAGRVHLANAQTPSSAPSPFVVQSDGCDNLLQFDVFVQLDGRFALHDSAGSIVDTFAIRRFRPSVQGRVLRHFEFFFNPDFAGGTLVVQDAYFDTVFSKAFRVRLGKFKTPIGLERLMSANGLTFAERALPTELTPNRDVGVQVLAELVDGMFSYMASIVNGVPDLASGDVDTNDGKVVTGRVIVRPSARRADSKWNGLGVGIGGGTGRVNELPFLRSATLFQPFFMYDDAAGDGNRVRVSPQAFYYYKSFAAFAEYMRSAQPIRRDDVRADIDHTAWEISGSYLLTGEAATDHLIRPSNDFDFGGGHVGALQVAARYHTVEVDDEAFARGLAAPGSSRKADAFTIGVNWSLNPFIKYVLNFERTVFDGDAHGPRPAENGLVVRAQLYF
jgi:phosphate-selective porin OprO and OprP